ncbi:MAG TPA: hypothetical protein VFT64_09210 [Rickettsiales bacterium]|nr:hypothetical protein [Rickettsiales bacterium]
MFIFRLLFIICAIFLLLVLGMASALLLRLRTGMNHSFTQNGPRPSTNYKNYKDDGNVIEGDYKVLDESSKE